MKIAIVQKSDLKVISWYEDEIPPYYARWNGPWGDSAVVALVQFPSENADFHALKASVDGQGNYSVAEDQATLDAWLASIEV